MGEMSTSCSNLGKCSRGLVPCGQADWPKPNLAKQVQKFSIEVLQICPTPSWPLAATKHMQQKPNTNKTKEKKHYCEEVGPYVETNPPGRV